MKKTILIGASGCGKTTLIQRLEDAELRYSKTQVVEHYLNFIDTPGEYLEQRGLYRALIVTAADADVIGLVQDCSASGSWMPPAFAMSFAKPVFGIVTKIDLATGPAEIAAARETLEHAGTERVFEVSAVKSLGLAPLVAYLEDDPQTVDDGAALGPREAAGQGVAR
jgi:ethanolamine utilization protein EutP